MAKQLTTKSRPTGANTLVIPDMEVFYPWGTLAYVSSGDVLPLKNLTQVTESEGHPRNRKGTRDSGGPFYTSKITLGSIPTVSFDVTAFSGFKYKYSGPIFPGNYTKWRDSEVPVVHRSKDTSDLDPAGATAIARCSPVNPVDTLGQGLAEGYREGLPSLPGIQSWEKRVGILKDLGGEFLNVVFGWEPLVGEVRSFASTVRDSRDLLMQYHRNQGSNVRRTFRFPIDESVQTDVVQTNTHAEPQLGFGGNGFDFRTENAANVLRVVKTRREKWFVGSFTYAVPSQTDTWRRMLGYGSDADKLFGIALTPELLWNIAPWSWAVDWFSNAGDVITNVSNFSGAGQVMRYGYMMEAVTTSIVHTMDRSAFFLNGAELAPPTLEYIITSKVRRPANPYGFGLTLDGLSPLQIAIAAAVGISLL